MRVGYNDDGNDWAKTWNPRNDSSYFYNYALYWLTLETWQVTQLCHKWVNITLIAQTSESLDNKWSDYATDLTIETVELITDWS